MVDQVEISDRVDRGRDVKKEEEKWTRGEYSMVVRGKVNTNGEESSRDSP